ELSVFSSLDGDGLYVFLKIEGFCSYLIFARLNGLKGEVSFFICHCTQAFSAAETFKDDRYVGNNCSVRINDSAIHSHTRISTLSKANNYQRNNEDHCGAQSQHASGSLVDVST